MRKVFCDMCGKEITGVIYVWHRRANIPPDDEFGMDAEAPKHFDLCDHCDGQVGWLITDHDAIVYVP